MTVLPDYVTISPEPVCLSGGRFGAYQHVKSKAELEAENRELIKRIVRLEQYIASIKEKGIYITDRCWQSDIPQIISELRKNKQAGLMCFIPQDTDLVLENPK